VKIITLKGLVGILVLASTALVVSACNTSKATIDTFAKFTSSTSPGDWINADGVIRESQKARLFTAVAFENLEQDIARGNGEYLTSLGVFPPKHRKPLGRGIRATILSCSLLTGGQRKTC